MRHILLPLILGILAISFHACEYEEFEPIELDDSDTISYAEVISPLFESSCLGSGCHVSVGGVPPNLEPEFAYLSITGGGYVDTLNPEGSTLYVRMSQDMPPSGTLSELEIQQVLLWIKQGAREN